MSLEQDLSSFNLPLPSVQHSFMLEARKQGLGELQKFLGSCIGVGPVYERTAMEPDRGRGKGNQKPLIFPVQIFGNLIYLCRGSIGKF